MISSKLDVSVGYRISYARRSHKAMTSQHVADFLGITLRELEQIEAGSIRASGEQIALLADLLGVNPSWFFVAPVCR